MKFYSYILAMKKETFFILAIMIAWIGMLLWTFFWWSNKKPEIKDTPIWFIEQIIETWDIEWISGDLIIDKKEWTWTTEINKYVEIVVMMPSYFYTLWWKNFAQDLYEEKNVYMNFKFIDNLNEYRDIITDETFSDADLALIPYDWMEYMNPNTFSFQKNVDIDFDKLISPVINNSEISFLPFAVDPMIMYIPSEYKIQNNFTAILDFIYDWSPIKNLSFPLFFWITTEDYDNEWFLREYQDIFRYAMMHYFTTYRDANSLESWLESNILWYYKTNTLNTIIKKISDQNCDNFPSICMQLYDFVTIRFWFLSDKDIVNQYFPTKKTEFHEISKNITPMYSIESPFRLRWWIIPKTVENVDEINGVYLFLAQYMKKHSEYPLWGSTLSAFSWSGTKLIDNEFIWIRWYLLEWWWKFLEVVRSSNSFWQLIEHQISAKDYLRL